MDLRNHAMYINLICMYVTFNILPIMLHAIKSTREDITPKIQFIGPPIKIHGYKTNCATNTISRAIAIIF